MGILVQDDEIKNLSFIKLFYLLPYNLPWSNKTVIDQVVSLGRVREMRWTYSWKYVQVKV